jgi:hypothetical protein
MKPHEPKNRDKTRAKRRAIKNQTEKRKKATYQKEINEVLQGQ